MRIVGDRLVEIRGARAGSGYPLGDGPVVIGRGADCQVPVASEHASRRHAQVRGQDGAFLLRDLGSKNGTMLNRRRIEGEVQLAEGDEIGVPGGAWVYRRGDATLTVRLPAVLAALSVDAKRAEVHVGGRAIEVTAHELLALAALAADPGMLVTKDELARRVWPESGGIVSDESIEQLVSRLRRKLGDHARDPRYLVTVRGLGYRLFTTDERSG